jgi:hypothetical protein
VLRATVEKVEMLLKQRTKFVRHHQGNALVGRPDATSR